MVLKVRVAVGLAVLKFTGNELECDADCQSGSWPLPHSTDCSKGQDCKSWF